MKITTLATPVIVAAACAAFACPASAMAATPTPQPAKSTATKAPGIAFNWVASSFTVDNYTNHTETFQYDSDGSGAGYKAQWLNSDGTDVQHDPAHPTDPIVVNVPALTSHTFYIEFSANDHYDLASNGSADLYLENDGTSEAVIHVSSHNDDYLHSWEHFQLRHNGLPPEPLVESTQRVERPDMYEHLGEFYDLLNASEPVVFRDAPKTR